MTTLESRRPQSGLAAVVLVVIVVLIFAAIAAGAIVFRARLETQPPQVALSPDSDMLGLAPLEIVVTDAGAGLKAVTATLTQGGAAQTLASEQYAKPVPEKKISVALAKVPGIKEGPATLRVTARDASLWHWLRGNETVVEKNITIDVTPPSIELIADERYVNFGGSGAIAYKVSPDTAKTGVKIAGDWFPGVKGVVQGHPDYYFAFFAHPYNAAPEDRPTLIATDKAGNTQEMRLSYELKNVKYRKSTIALTDNFYQNKVIPLQHDLAKRQGSVKDVFVSVNKGVRKENEDKIREVTSKFTPKVLWSGAFEELGNAKVEANFADYRTYTYNGEPIDSAYHLGYDFAATKHYPIGAANSGIIAFTGDLGLYGNAIIIDHGLGLYTLYGHCSQVDVKPGDHVTKGQIIGKTGETGFAGGDHLHFGVYLDGVPVLPVEWWDQHWINDHVAPKLQGQSGQQIAEDRQSQRIARRKATHGKRHR